ncbi:MAG: crotonase/enoyl-CoA hydratase family protein [Gammaproteobacteria bacterium]|uniref:crotonase/enoyl-CoA hydratase family protein n=1 Tax=Pseudomaricurvus alcaniphilus TaxID=1166482 RepID=UPI0014074450|nr:crotonase/enoyl-CoA hydratase family protein [Pseudomaricurvus alcaniphilus]MBR9909227.1 crotonase/enoyl-CoA hydratase family protein [Gammaproteobacteria bacterium]NHN38231.1 crotonase/enoyl-CoA hydratase family protein [Pseudomaricurvus alcaniphilus]
MNSFLQLERDGAILKVTLNDPDSRNALTSPEQFQEIVSLCEELRHDYSVKVIILTGAGASFCAGGNIKDMRDRAGIFAGNPFELRDGYRNGIQRIPTALYNLDIPVVAAINGHAIGAGLDLTCMCDVRIAAEGAKFAESFVKLGIVPGDGGAWLLPRVIGMPKASLMALTGDMIDARQALEYGLVTEVVPREELDETALAIAKRIAVNPAHALRLTKRLLREGQHMRLDSLLEMSAAYQSIAHHTEDHEEAVSAFLEKRAPEFKGR